MRNEKQIDMFEEALKRAYPKKETVSEPSADWNSSLMSAVKEEYKSEKAEVEDLENSFLHYSWVAAAIAASLIIVSGIVFSIRSNDLEDNLQELYSDDTLDTITMEIASR